MKLSRLINLDSKLNTISFQHLKDEVTNLTSQLLEIEDVDGEYLPALIKGLSEFEVLADKFEKTIQHIRSDVDKNIKTQAEPLITAPYEFANIEFEREHRILPLSEDDEKQIAVRVVQYTSWQHPVLEIGPGDGKWTRWLVSGDPLYLLEVHKEFLETTTSKFNSTYNKKIRKYLIGPDANKSFIDTSDLPSGQFGFIFAWNVFDYYPQPLIQDYLANCFKLLKPGGAMMFSYNNCEELLSAALAEPSDKYPKGPKSWTPKWAITEIVTRVGFEIIYYGTTNKTTHWIEIKKPGELTSIRASQTLATIKRDLSQKTVDISPDPVYNKEQISRLKQIAIQMNIDSSDNIMRDKHTPHQLYTMIEIARKQK